MDGSLDALDAALSHCVEGVLNLLCRRLVHEADDADGEEGEEEAGDDFVEAEEGELLPDEDSDATDDDAGDDAVPRRALPEEAHEDGGAESGAEARPGVGDHVEDEAVRVEPEENREARDDEDARARDPDELRLLGIFMDERAVEILRERRRRDEKLARRRAHEGREHRREDEPRGDRREQLIRHDEEHRLRRRARELLREEHAADHADGDCRGERKDDPGHRDVRRAPDLAGRADRHEAHEDVRLTEIADAPGEQRDELDGTERRAVGLRERLEHRRLDAADLRERAFETAVCHRTADGDDEDREEHHDALDEIRARDREEPADERIEDDRPRADEDRVFIRDAEHRLEEPPRRDKPRRRVDDEKDEDENRGHDAQEVRRIVVAVLEEFRQRERVVGELGVLAQAGGDEMPVRPGADGDADGDPARVEPREIREPRHAHEHPAAHIRRLRRQRRHPRAELAVAEKVVAHVARAPIVIDADRHHDADVEHEGIDDGKVMCQGNSSPPICDFAMGTMTSLLYKKGARTRKRFKEPLINLALCLCVSELSSRRRQILNVDLLRLRFVS